MSELGLVDPRLLRSVRVEIDWFSGDPTRDYILGAAAVDAIREVLPASRPGPRARAFTLTGPYGTGKSALVLYLADLLAGNELRGERTRREFKAACGVSVPQSRFLPVLITCSSAPLAALITEGCQSACVRLGVDPVSTVPELSELAQNHGFDGVLMVLDELGKALEFAGREPLLADPFILQDLAEFAARNEFPVILLGVLHQAFAGYADGLRTTTRNEWTKIQGRFRDLAFLPPEEMLARLVAESIGSMAPASSQVDEIAESVQHLPGIWPSFIPKKKFQELCRKSWPLHPLTLAALPVLMRRFGQNERSLFAFLVERGLLVEHRSSSAVVRLCDLFEHVSDWIGHGSRSHAAARRWRVALEILHSRPALGGEERDILRTLALLTALGRFAPFNATTEAISLAVGMNALPTLEKLAKRNHIVHRRHLGAWVLWEGSDVDVEGLLDEARLKVAGRINLGRLLLDSNAVRSGIAQRHYEETGTLRWFRPIVFTDPDSASLPHKSSDPSNGQLVIALGATPSAQLEFEAWAKSIERPDIIFAVAHRAPAFTRLAEELEALQLVEAESPELRGDRVAREELAARKATLTAELSTEAERLLDPAGADGCIFYLGGIELSVESRRELTQRFSNACDELFILSPILRNELINRRSLSSAAAAARRELIERMLLRSAEPRLGYVESYPPDRAIYESVLLDSGLHRETNKGVWAFYSPPPADPAKILPVWLHLEERLFGEFPEPVRVDHLAAELKAPPFGLVDGPFPIILAAFLLAHREETAMYREGAFIPEMGIAHWELLLRRPEFFAVAGCRQSGSRGQALELICERLGVSPPALMPAVRYIIKAIDSLPPRARSTKDILSSSAALRSAALEARSPEAFFFDEVPRALGLPQLGESENEAAAAEFLSRLRAALQDLNCVVPRTRSSARAELAAAAGFPADDAGFEALRRAAASMRDRLDDSKARELCSRLMAPDTESAEIGALALVAMRPVETWTDSDREGFRNRAIAIAQEIRRETIRSGAVDSRDVDARAERLAEDMLANLSPRSREEGPVVIAALRRVLKKLEEQADEQR